MNPIGEVDAPPGVEEYAGGALEGLPLFVNNIILFVIVVAGLYALINFLLAGYAFMSAGDDPKKMAAATQKIWQTILGLTVAVGSFVIAAIIGRLLYGPGGWNALMQFTIFTPGP